MVNPNKPGAAGVTGQWLDSQVAYDGPDCLKWPFGCDSHGYGQVAYAGKVRRAHRVMCELVNGPPPTPDHEAAHSCGRGANGCVNPKHLSWKTRSENHLDRRGHGTAKTAPFGQGGHVLSPAQRQRVRELDGRVTRTKLAEMFEVSRRTIERACAEQSQT